VSSATALRAAGLLTTIDADPHTVAVGPEMDKLVWDWARLVNQQVPYLWYANKVNQFTCSTAHFTDWPPENARQTGLIWDIMDNDMCGGLVVALGPG